MALEHETDAILRLLAERTIGERESCRLDAVMGTDIPPGIKVFFKAEIRRRIEDDLRKSSWFTGIRQSDPGAARVARTLLSSMTDAYRFTRQEFLDALDLAVHFVANYLCRPQWTLENFLFDRAPRLTLEELAEGLTFFFDFRYLGELTMRSLQRQGKNEVGREECQSLIRKIDDEIIRQHSARELASLTRPLFLFFRLSGNQPDGAIPVEAILAFFEDKKLKILTEYVRGICHLRNQTHVTIEDLSRLIDDLYAGKPGPAPDPAPPVPEGPAITQDAVPAPPAPEEPAITQDTVPAPPAPEEPPATQVTVPDPPALEEPAFTQDTVPAPPMPDEPSVTQATVPAPPAPEEPPATQVTVPDPPALEEPAFTQDTVPAPPMPDEPSVTQVTDPAPPAPEEPPATQATVPDPPVPGEPPVTQAPVPSPVEPVTSQPPAPPTPAAAPVERAPAPGNLKVNVALSLTYAGLRQNIVGRAALPDLSTLIQPEERDRFISQVFRGDAAHYSGALVMLDSLVSWQDAEAYLHELYRMNNLDSQASDVIAFADTVRKRYTTDERVPQ